VKLIFRFVFAISILMICGAQEARADIWGDYLAQIEDKFDRASTPQKQYDIISEPVNREYLYFLKSISEINPVALRQNVGKGALSYHTSEGKEKLNCDKMTALNLAISLGNVSAVRKFLSVVSDVNVDELTAWGYRQPYYPAHFALHPDYPRAKKQDQTAQLEIIDMLAEKGADFNKIFRHKEMGVYLNPPLSAGQPSGGVSYNNMESLRARAMLFGANPGLQGSSFYGIEFKGKSSFYLVTKYALQYYCEVVKNKGLNSMHPYPTVMEVLQEYSKSIGFDLEGFQNSAKKIAKLDNQIAKREDEIAKFKDQKTKKARAKVRHLENVKAELERDRKKSSQSLKKFKAPSVF